MLNVPVVSFLLLAAGLALGGSAEQPKKKLKPFDYQGCYRVAVAGWRGPSLLDAAEKTPPATIELTNIRFKGFRSETFVVKPALGARAGRFSMLFWRLTDEGEVEMVFSTGLSGVSLHLKREGDALLGTARASGDVNPDELYQTAGARADRVSCGGPQ